MGLDKTLPENILKRMSAADRKAAGQKTAGEAQAAFVVRSEKKEQDILIQWLHLRGYPFCRARMDKKSTINEGWPDFTVFHNGKVALVEMKVPGGKLSFPQEMCIKALCAEGILVTVCYSAAEAIEWLRLILL